MSEPVDQSDATMALIRRTIWLMRGHAIWRTKGRRQGCVQGLPCPSPGRRGVDQDKCALQPVPQTAAVAAACDLERIRPYITYWGCGSLVTT